MTSEHFNIVCVERETDISNIIRNTYGSLRYLLETVTIERDVEEVLMKRSANLLIVDNDYAGYDSKQLRLCRQTNAHLFVVLISSDKTIARELEDCNYFKIISPEELPHKFSAILSEAYSFFTEGIYSGLTYGKLLKQSLNKLSGIVIITDKQGEVVFFNHDAEKILGFDDDIYKQDNLISALVDGPKIWKYIIDSCCLDHDQEHLFLLKFLNSRQEILVKQMRIQSIEIEQRYLVMQEQVSPPQRTAGLEQDEPALLETFAESVANELLNPANVLSGRLQMMRKTIAENHPLQKQANSIEMQIKRIDEIISKLLTFARLEQDYIPQKINIDEVFKSVQMDPSIARLLQREGLKITFASSANKLHLYGQIAQFDLLLKMLLEICFNCLSSNGSLQVSNHQQNESLVIWFELTYAEDLYKDALSVQSYLCPEPASEKQKSIETTIVKQILKQYNANYDVVRLDRKTEKLELRFPLSHHSVEEAQ